MHPKKQRPQSSSEMGEFFLGPTGYFCLLKVDFFIDDSLYFLALTT
jgi:hypothetical protein